MNRRSFLSSLLALVAAPLALKPMIGPRSAVGEAPTPKFDHIIPPRPRHTETWTKPLVTGAPYFSKCRFETERERKARRV